jgi:hypothetical protein
LNRLITSVITISLLLSFSLFAEEGSSMQKPIDQRSFRLGSASTFSELVGVGVKKLALSSALLPAEMDEMAEDIKRIAEGFGVQTYRESDLIVTDLFPADVATGKDVMLLYKGSTLDEYLALKIKKDKLLKSGKYEGKARKGIAIDFGKLLSYPDANIEEKLNKTSHP